jgi:hypothetical protein
MIIDGGSIILAIGSIIILIAIFTDSNDDRGHADC